MENLQKEFNKKYITNTFLVKPKRADGYEIEDWNETFENVYAYAYNLFFEDKKQVNEFIKEQLNETFLDEKTQKELFNKLVILDLNNGEKNKEIVKDIFDEVLILNNKVNIDLHEFKTISFIITNNVIGKYVVFVEGGKMFAEERYVDLIKSWVYLDKYDAIYDFEDIVKNEELIKEYLKLA